MSDCLKFRYRFRELTKEGYKEWFEYYILDEIEKGAVITTAKVISRDLFTGLYDRHGREIYQRDIVQQFNFEDPAFRRVVEWRDGAFCYNNPIAGVDEFIAYAINRYFEWINGKSEKIEVIGNTHENPELLHSKQVY